MADGVAAMREALPADTIICNGAGNFSGWWHRYWPYGGAGTQLAPTAGAMGYGPPAAVAAALRFANGAVGTLNATTACFPGFPERIDMIRMHQEREYPARVSGTGLSNPDFAALARAYGGWAATVETTAEFAPALAEAKGRSGLRLLHLKTDPERISAGTTISALRSR